jgi:hypothetical protein
MKLLPIISLALILFTACAPTPEKQQWKKGNLHTHSLWSDGDDFPEMIIKWYKDHNYQFVALSDHNTIADSQRWYKMGERESKNNTLNKYKQAFGNWVEEKDSAEATYVRLKTFDEYKSKMEVPGTFNIIKSEEVTSSFERKPIHINVSNIENYIAPITGNSVVEVMQQTLDHVHEQREETGTPMFAHINHPNFGYGISANDFKELNGERFFEVYNGHPSVHNEGDAEHISIEEMWDVINVSYIEQGKPLLYGIGTDDSHHYHTLSSKHSNSGRGWVMVDTDQIDANSVIIAMEAGNFYASSGVDLKTVRHTEKQYFVEIDAVSGYEYEIVFYGLKKGGTSVEELYKTSGTSATYKFKDDDVFVRAKVNSNYKIPNPYKEGETSQAWTQPVNIKKF